MAVDFARSLAEVRRGGADLGADTCLFHVEIRPETCSTQFRKSYGLSLWEDPLGESLDESELSTPQDMSAMFRAPNYVSREMTPGGEEIDRGWIGKGRVHFTAQHASSVHDHYYSTITTVVITMMMMMMMMIMMMMMMMCFDGNLPVFNLFIFFGKQNFGTSGQWKNASLWSW